MTRPQPSDVDAFFGGAIHDAPELVGPVGAAEARALGGGLASRRGVELDAFEAAAPASDPPTGSSAELRHIGDSLSEDAYWRQPIWKRIVTIGAGPATNLAFAVVIFAVVLMSAGGKATTTVSRRASKGARHRRSACSRGDRILAIDGAPRRRRRRSRAHLRLEGRRAHARRPAQRRAGRRSGRSGRRSTKASTASASNSARSRSAASSRGRSRCCSRRD